MFVTAAADSDCDFEFMLTLHVVTVGLSRITDILVPYNIIYLTDLEIMLVIII